MNTLVDDTAHHAREVAAQLSAGRDRLIELNSCDPQHASMLVSALTDDDHSDPLPAFLSAAFDYFGVEQEDHSAHTITLRPSERLTGHFPGLTDDGLTATFDRATALAREDMHYMTWEHPIAKEALAMILRGETGNATLNTISLRALPAGTMLLEAWFTVAVVAPAHLQIERYLSLRPTRLLVTSGGKDVGATLSAQQLDSLCKDVDKKTARAVLGQVRAGLSTQIEHAKRLAEQQLPALVEGAGNTLHEALDAELTRLRDLAAVNPNVRQEEIEHLEHVIEQSATLLARAQMRLDALRLVVNT